MPTIPPDLSAKLFDLGITPWSVPWRRLPDYPARYHWSQYMCPCGSRPNADQRVHLTKVPCNGRRIFIGQCGWCMTIYWREETD